MKHSHIPYEYMSIRKQMTVFRQKTLNFQELVGSITNYSCEKIINIIMAKVQTFRDSYPVL